MLILYAAASLNVFVLIVFQTEFFRVFYQHWLLQDIREATKLEYVCFATKTFEASAYFFFRNAQLQELFKEPSYECVIFYFFLPNLMQFDFLV